jgi:hypothetical protein
MQKLIIATIGLSLSMGVAATAIAQSAQTPGQMQTAPGTNGDGTTAMPSGPSSGSAPSTSSSQGDPSNNNNTATQGAPSSSDNSSSGSMPPAPSASHSYPRCTATVHDQCRQHR